MPEPSSTYSRWSTYLRETDVYTWLDFVISIIVLIIQSQLKKKKSSCRREKNWGRETEKEANQPSGDKADFFCNALFSFWLITTKKKGARHKVDLKSVKNDTLKGRGAELVAKLTVKHLANRWAKNQSAPKINKMKRLNSQPRHLRLSESSLVLRSIQIPWAG